MLFRLLIIISAWLFGSQAANSQSIEQIKADSKTFLYGEGWGESLRIADNAALAELISKVSVDVRNDFTTIEKEQNVGNSFTAESNYESIIKTYSHSTLTNTERIILKNEPDAHVFRYIRRSEIDRIFEGRKNKILEYVGIANAANEQEQVEDALRYYYWSYVLLTSMRYPNEIKYTDDNGEEHILMAWLPFQIEQILGDLSVKFNGRSSTDANVVNVGFYYKEKPVKSIGYTYFDGVDWSTVYTAKDGIGILELRPQSPENIQIKFEYECMGEALIDSEICDVIKAVKGTLFKKAYTNIKISEVNTPKSKPQLALLENEKSSIDISNSANIDNEGCKQAVKKISYAIIQKRYTGIEELFTGEGYSIFEKLIKYGQARLLDSSNLSFMKMNNGICCRNLMMSFSFANNNRTFVENVVFVFDAQHKISNITFGLDQQSTSDILSKRAWDDSSKMQLISFLENYKTAYALKRLDYINDIFSDDALIITGRVVKRAVPNEVMRNNQYVEFTRHNKQDYLKRLSRIFSSNEYINLKFANTDLTKMGKGGELYGIQIRQDYFSSHYGDTGYLFLMVDLNNPDNPIIHVRTWQPEPDPNFGIIGAGDF